ncbi:MAG: murein transglycosylase A, partial [bacterium]|nr:murein transglycosylase A [bacterium]
MLMLTGKKKYIVLGIVLALVLITAVYILLKREKRPIEWTPANSLLPVSAPVIEDIRDVGYLVQAIDSSLRYFEKKDPEAAVAFGKEWVPVNRIQESLLDFKTKLQEYGLTEIFFNYIRQNYRFYRSGAKETLFTGYYEADLNGSLTQSETYRYPLYGKPDDLHRIELSQFYFFKRYKGLPSVLRGKMSEKKPGTIVPYHSREEIDGQQKLAGRGLEIVWIDNPIDVFFLQIQGSGIVQLDTGGTMRVNYAESNGHPYYAIGKWLLQRNILTYENMSMQSIRGYLETHPENIDEIFNTNPSYVFFRVVEEGPIGSIGVPLTAFRSIATDRRLFPKGALCFIDTQLPVFDDQNNVKEWKPFRGFVLNQDTGGAIRGAGRVDLFTGYGEQSRLTAGHMKEMGSFYFLVKKEGE